MRQIFKRLRTATAATGMALVLGLGLGADKADAATLGQFIPVAGGAEVSGTGSATLSSTGIGFVGAGVASGGSIIGAVPLPSNTLNLTATGASISSGSFSLFGPPVSPSPLPATLFGTFLDAKAETGMLSFLFAVAPTSSLSDFGSHVIYTLSTPTFSSSSFADLGQIPGRNTVTVSGVSFAITEATVIPLPAGLVLLLTGLGALGLMRRRTAA